MTRFGSKAGTLRFIEKSFFHTSLKFTPYCDYKSTNAFHADFPGVYTIDELLNLSTTEKIHFKTNVIDGSVVDSLRQPILFSFVLDIPSGYKVLGEPETIQYKKSYVLNTITFYLEDDKKHEFDLSGETLSFTLQMIKI